MAGELHTTPHLPPGLHVIHRGLGMTLPQKQRTCVVLTFDPVATVKGDLAVDLGLVWLDDDEEPPRHRAVQLPLGPRVLDSREHVLVGSGRESQPVGGDAERGGQGPGQRRPSGRLVASLLLTGPC